MTKPYTGLDKLNKEFAYKVQLWLASNPEIKVTETWRSEERQRELLKKGLSKIKRSLHQDGLAVDICFEKSPIYPKDMRKWRKVADSAKNYGIERGYDLRKWDKPHFQATSHILELIQEEMSKFKQTFDKEVENPLFTSHDGSAPLSEQETKHLLEIGLKRLEDRILTKIMDILSKR